MDLYFATFGKRWKNDLQNYTGVAVYDPPTVNSLSRMAHKGALKNCVQF